MKTIIQQIAIELVEKVLRNLQGNGISNIGQAAKELQSITNTAVLEIIGAAIREVDTALVAANKERRVDGLRIKERDVPRTLLTDLGELQYRRTYFETKDGQRCYLADHVIGVEAYERLSKDLCATLVQHAADKSMEKAAKDAGVAVSRQTVNNKVLALKEVAVEAVRAEETPEELHLFVDEDHVHMKSGRGAIVPLATVTEGIDTSTKRHRTVNPVHFEGYGMNNHTFFEGIAAFIYEKYDMAQVKQVYVHADGARWIEAAADYLPNVQFVMDEFHLQKYLRKLGSLEGASPYVAAICKAIQNDAFETFVSYCAAIDKKQDKKGREKLTALVNYFQNNWDAIVLRMKGETCGSCTEPLVSHILSKRLSRNPLAWSEHGMRQMAMLRVYTQNGCVVKARDIRISRSKAALKQDEKGHAAGYAKYCAYAEKQMDEVLNHKLDWGIFEKFHFQNGKLDGTHMILKAYGRTRDTFASA